MSTTTRIAAGALVAAASAAAWETARRRELGRVHADPEHARLTRPLTGEERTVTAPDGTALHVELFGPEDGDPIVLIHGWTCAIRFWVGQIEDLSRTHRVIAYDLRGHGRSAPPAGGDFSTTRLAEDLQAVLEATVPDGRRAVLAGHSLGAMTIVAWAGERPEEVRRRAAGVALLNTGMGDLVTDSLVVRTPDALGKVKARIGRHVLGAQAPLPPASPISGRVLRYAVLCGAASPAQVAFCQELVLDCRREVRGGCGRMLSELDLIASLEHVTVPTVVMAGAQDRLTPPKHAERMVAVLPHVVEHRVVEDTGHMGPIEAHEEVRELLELLAAHTGRDADHGAAAAAGAV